MPKAIISKFLYIFFIFAILPYRNAVYALDINVIPSDSEKAFIILSGAFEFGDEEKFNSSVQKFSKAAILLDSDGGNLSSALRIGEIIRLKGFSTGVAPKTICASACALAWLGGGTRYMSDQSRIGFHAASINTNGTDVENGQANALIGAYVTRLGLSERAVAYITEASPNNIAWITPDLAKSLGIYVEKLEIPDSTDVAETKLFSSYVGNNEPHRRDLYYVTGLDPHGDNWLALKSAPNLNSNRIDKLTPNTKLIYLGRSGHWISVRTLKGVFGWVYDRYVACCVAD